MTLHAKTRKAQSAMEYLMTYGWAILIIAVVLGVLFNIGVFNTGSALGTSCIAYSGFLCSSPIYSHATGNVIVTLGQNTGTDWATANIAFMPQGSQLSSGIPEVSSLGANTFNSITNGGIANSITGGLVSGQSESLGFPVSSSTTTNAGASAAGAFWAAYTVSGSSSMYYVEMATATLKAV